MYTKSLLNNYMYSLLRNGPTFCNSVLLSVRNSDNLNCFKAKLNALISR